MLTASTRSSRGLNGFTLVAFMLRMVIASKKAPRLLRIAAAATVTLFSRRRFVS